MNSNKKNPLTAILGVVFLSGAVPVSASGARSGAAFLGISPSARSMSLGASDVVSSVGPESMGSNPANLGLLGRRFEVLTSYSGVAAQTQYTHAAAALAAPPSLKPLDGLGISVTRLGVLGLETADASGRRTGSTFGSSDLVMGLGASARLGPGLRLGLTMKALQSTIAGYRSNIPLAADAGLRYEAPRFALALSVNHLGQGIRFIRQTDPLPAAVNLGAEVSLGGPVFGVLNLRRPLREPGVDAGFGMGVALGPVAFRAGLTAKGTQGGRLAMGGRDSLLGAVLAGVGVQAGPARFDYAFSQIGDEVGLGHRVSMSMGWGRRASD